MTAPPNPVPPNPAVLRLDRLGTALLDLPGAGSASFDHICATAVPGLAGGDEAVPADAWEKRLFVAEGGVGEAVPAIRHVRRADSPWGRYTVWFRDWLRAHPERRDEYARVKRDLSAANAGKPDFDDYTRAKSAFFDEVQHKFTRWATRADGGGS